MVIANWIDFGNWNSGAYQKTMQNLLAKVTFGLLVPDQDYRKSKTVSPEIFDKVYNTYKIEGAVAINDPFKKQSVIFTRDAFIDLLDIVGAEMLRATGEASTKNVILATQLMITFVIKEDEVVKSAGALAPAVAGATTGAATAPTLFVGLIDRGQLSPVKSFTPQLREQIDTAEELTEAVQQNVAGFLAALPGMIKIEVMLKDKVQTPDGQTLIGTLGKVQTSISPKGKLRYRRFRNSFVVAEISVLKNTGGKTSIGEIVVGALDESALDPAPEQLVALGNALSRKAISTNVLEFTSISLAPASAGALVTEAGLGNAVTPATPAEPVPAPLPVQTEPTSAEIAARLSPVPFQINMPKNGIFRWLGGIGNLVRREGTTILTFDIVEVLSPEEKRNAGNYGGQTAAASEKLKRV